MIEDPPRYDSFQQQPQSQSQPQPQPHPPPSSRQSQAPPHPRRSNPEFSTPHLTQHRRLPSLNSQGSHPDPNTHSGPERTQHRRTSSSSPVPGFTVPSHNNGQQARHDQRLLSETTSQEASGRHSNQTEQPASQQERAILRDYSPQSNGDPAGHLFKTASGTNDPRSIEKSSQDPDGRRSSRSRLGRPDAIDGKVKKRPMFEVPGSMEELEPRG